MTTVTAAEFNRRPSQVKREAAQGPVIITEHDRPSYVLLRYDDYQQLRGTPSDLATWLQMEEDIDFDIPEVGFDIRPVDW